MGTSTVLSCHQWSPLAIYDVNKYYFATGGLFGPSSLASMHR